MNTIIIDNYDSFTFNLLHLVKDLGAKCTTVRNDCFCLSDLERFDKIILSPGPGIPSESGLLLDVINAYARRKPILGVCLGHQAIGEAFGAKLINLPKVFHGIQTPINITKDDYLLADLESPLLVGRYHSWIVSEEDLPPCLEVIARSDEGQIMALRHSSFDIRGIQFHPESVLTPSGRKIIKNWLEH